MAQLILGSEARGTDRSIGRLTAVVGEAGTGMVTHLVVNADDVAGSERLVPVDHLSEVDDDRIVIDLTRHEFFELPTFETCVAVGMPIEARSWVTFATHERIPASRVALRRLTRVVDANGHRVGHLHGLTLDDTDRRITSLLVRTAHLLHHDQAVIAATDVTSFGETEVRLHERAAVETPASTHS